MPISPYDLNMARGHPEHAKADVGKLKFNLLPMMGRWKALHANVIDIPIK